MPHSHPLAQRCQPTLLGIPPLVQKPSVTGPALGEHVCVAQLCSYFHSHTCTHIQAHTHKVLTNTHTCTHVHTYVHAHTHTSIHMVLTNMHTCTHRHTPYVYTHTCTHKALRNKHPPHTHVCMHTHTNTALTNTHAYAHTHTYTYMHSHTHICTCPVCLHFLGLEVGRLRPLQAGLLQRFLHTQSSHAAAHGRRIFSEEASEAWQRPKLGSPTPTHELMSCSFLLCGPEGGPQHGSAQALSHPPLPPHSDTCPQTLCLAHGSHMLVHVAFGNRKPHSSGIRQVTGPLGTSVSSSAGWKG